MSRMSEASYHKCGLWVPNFSVKLSRNPWFSIRSNVESSSDIGFEDLTLRFVNFWPEIPEPSFGGLTFEQCPTDEVLGQHKYEPRF